MLRSESIWDEKPKTRSTYDWSDPIFHSRFVFKNNGVLFENDLIQIGVKSEYRQNLGRLGLFYGNKTQTVLQVSERIQLNQTVRSNGRSIVF